MIVIVLVILIAAIAGYRFYPETRLPQGAKIDRIEVFKSARRMHVYQNGELLKTYVISLGKNPVGTKQFEGDFKTPEGLYTINDRNPNSNYHKNLGVSYPEPRDIERSKSLGRPTGGDIKIHGLRNGSGAIGKFHRWRDWTAGCIAVTNGEIDELFGVVEDGTVIEIFP